MALHLILLVHETGWFFNLFAYYLIQAQLLVIYHDKIIQPRFQGFSLGGRGERASPFRRKSPGNEVEDHHFSKN